VEAFLKAHGDDDEGLKGEQKRVAEGKLSSSKCQQNQLTGGTDLLKAEPMGK
jgi:hypothetical protein